jgi:hypothetical protein
MTRLVTSVVAVALVAPALASAQTDAEKLAEVLKQRAGEVENTVADPSLRSPIATPKFEFTAEIADDKKTATAKAGFAWHAGWSGEIGFAGAFDKDADRSALTSLRELTSGSKGWFAVSYKRYRVDFDWKAQQVVCRQAAWAAGVRFQDFDCDESALEDASFAVQLAATAGPEPLERGVCQQFQRAMLTGPEVSAGADLPSGCDTIDVPALESRHGARFTHSYDARYKAALAATPPDTARALDLCNEFRRSRGLPPDDECDPAEFSEADKKSFGRSWKERFHAVRVEGEAAICDAYRLASGRLPTGLGGCRPSAPDPLFDTSFRDRFATTYRWLKTPILNLRVDAARPSFKYLDAALASHKDTHGIYSVSGTAGVLLVNDTLLAVTYSQGESWKPKDKVELCQPVPDTSAAACRADVVLGAPQQEDRRQLEGQIKGYLTNDVGAAVFVTRDFEKKAWGLEVPIYFMKDKKGGLAGGLVFSYRSDDDVYDLSVFVGQVFSVFN